ncbi:hypothetical protein WN48_06837 [Eufriesea mexicana]|nr:hypothetical protein WN48_06837 [Eufriesea mexicana]
MSSFSYKPYTIPKDIVHLSPRSGQEVHWSAAKGKATAISDKYEAFPSACTISSVSSFDFLPLALPCLPSFPQHSSTSFQKLISATISMPPDYHSEYPIFQSLQGDLLILAKFHQVTTSVYESWTAGNKDIKQSALKLGRVVLQLQQRPRPARKEYKPNQKVSQDSYEIPPKSVACGLFMPGYFSPVVDQRSSETATFFLVEEHLVTTSVYESWSAGNKDIKQSALKLGRVVLELQQRPRPARKEYKPNQKVSQDSYEIPPKSVACGLFMPGYFSPVVDQRSSETATFFLVEEHLPDFPGAAAACTRGCDTVDTLATSALQRITEVIHPIRCYRKRSESVIFHAILFSFVGPASAATFRFSEHRL